MEVKKKSKLAILGDKFLSLLLITWSPMFFIFCIIFLPDIVDKVNIVVEGQTNGFLIWVLELVPLYYIVTSFLIYFYVFYKALMRLLDKK